MATSVDYAFDLMIQIVSGGFRLSGCSAKTPSPHCRNLSVASVLWSREILPMP